MELKNTTLIGDIIEKYPFILDYLPSISPVFSRLRDPEMRGQMGKIANLEMVAGMGGIEVHDLIASISVEIERITGVKTDGDSDQVSSDREKLDSLKSIIMDLHSGKTVEEVKQRFLDLATEVDSTEIARMEQELIEGGLPQEEIKKLCDVHVEVFKESLDKKDDLGAPPGHPVHTFMKENELLEVYIAALNSLVDEVDGGDTEVLFSKKRDNMKNLIGYISKINFHYLRKENQLFPFLEKYEVSGPSQVMWALHDDIRKMIKEAGNMLDTNDFSPARDSIRQLTGTMKDMIYKEEKVLFPMSLEKLSDEDWGRVRRGEEEIGYAWIKPDEGWVSKDIPAGMESGDDRKIRLDEGYLNLEQLNFMLRTLPLDLSFVDADNKVAYYSATDDRIFPRSPGVIGREVKNCHPPKSVHVVERILSEFKAGNKDAAEFWINLNGRFLHIRYFAVRNSGGEFLGTMELSQDVTDIRSLEGQKRLLDWEE